MLFTASVSLSLRLLAFYMYRVVVGRSDFCYSAEAKYLAVVTERVPNIRPNFGRTLSLLGEMEIQNDFQIVAYKNVTLDFKWFV